MLRRESWFAGSMSVRRRTPSLHGLFFLGFCAVGAPLLATGSIGCSSEAQASPPTDPTEAVEAETSTPELATPKAQITKMTYWRQGNGVALTTYDPQKSLAPLIETVQPAV